MNTIVTGIQPTGNGCPHLGNYLGAIKQIPNLLENAKGYVMIADVHATTVDFDPAILKTSTNVAAAALMASGIPNDIIFKQSCIPQHFEMSVYLSHLASVGQMERMTQYKDKSEGKSIGFGLLSYPILMASDILCYNANIVPVGIDQHQHIQLVADLARKLNNKLGEDVINIPTPCFTKNPKIMDIINPEKKMSKSSKNQNGILYLNDSIDIVSKKIKKSTTDNKPYFTDDFQSQSLAIQNLVVIISELLDIPVEEICLQFQGKRYSELKNYMIDAYNTRIIPIKEEMDYLLKNKPVIYDCLDTGNIRAEKDADSVLKIVRKKLGLGI